MRLIGPGNGEKSDSHEGYVAGRYGDGAFSDIWTNEDGDGGGVSGVP
jgi:hypothetical protein